MTSASGDRSENLDRNYDLRAAFPDYVSYFESWRSRSEQARGLMPCILDVPYGAGSRHRVDFFPATPVGGPLLMFIHGGYWRSMDKSDFSFLAMPFVNRGVSLALINYDLFPGTTMSKLVAQVRQACSWVADNASRHGVPYKELHLAGWSAGAHLAAMAACDNPVCVPISSLLGISGVYDLCPILQTSANADFRLDEGEARRNSPILFQPPQRCSIAIVWGGNETGAFHRQSAAFAEAWRSKGADMATLQVADVHHYGVMNALGEEKSPVLDVAAALLRIPRLTQASLPDQARTR